ncbi:MAG: hypothetical protein ACI93R_001115 [Flavobacteriales bacterium]|jgi:hypothetical protein
MRTKLNSLDAVFIQPLAARPASYFMRWLPTLLFIALCTQTLLHTGLQSSS